MPIPDGGLPVERKCQKEQSVAFLSCSYSSLLDFMSNSWNVPVQGRFSDQCSSFCQSYVKDCDCDVTSEEHALPVIFDTHPLTCRFFNAILEPARFGALCLLDKLILDIQQQKTYMTSRCPFSNATLEQSSTNLNTVEVPSVTPVAVVKTASSHMYTVEPLPSNACDSGDGRILCSTIAVRTVDVKDASSAPVIKTGKIVASETKGVVEDGGGTTSNISLITPTRTLESGEKFTTPQTQATDTTGVHCQSAGTEKTDSEAISKMISPDADCSRHSLDNIRGDDTDETPSDGRDLHIDSIVTELKAPQSSSKSGESVVPAKSLSQAEGPIKDKDTSADSLVTKDDDNLQPLMSPQSKIVIGGGSTTTTASFSSSPFVRDAPVAIASSLHSSDTEGGSSDDQGSLAFSSHGTVAQSPSVLLSLSSSRLDFGVTNTTGIIGNGLGKQQQQQLPVGAPPNGLVAGQKESVFVRLSNRIKSLELNMSLSGQYLEELSRRYRKQMEEMQRAFNKTISALNDTARKAYERVSNC